MIKVEVNKPACACLAFVWFCVGMVWTIVVADTSHRHHPNSAVPFSEIALPVCLWLGPYIVVGGICGLITLYKTTGSLTPVKIKYVKKPVDKNLIKKYEKGEI